MTQEWLSAGYVSSKSESSKMMMLTFLSTIFRQLADREQQESILNASRSSRSHSHARLYDVDLAGYLRVSGLLLQDTRLEQVGNQVAS